jgi:hypothetical protein
MWLLFIYKVPNEPSAKRVYVWRKLKGMGAILLQDSAWVLPATVQTREKMQWLAAEINEMPEGFASLWEAQLIFTGRDTDLVQQFTAQVDTVYSDLLSQLAEPDADLHGLSKRYQQAKTQDYFGSPLGERVRQVLLERREEK